MKTPCRRAAVLISLLTAITPLGARSELVASWGNNGSYQMRAPVGLTDVEAIAAGERHSLALKSDGTVVAWGDPAGGATNVPAGLSGVTAIAASAGWSLALKSDGTVVGWGAYDTDFHLSELTGISAIAAGWYHWLALKSDGTLATWGSSNTTYSPTNMPAGLSNIVAVSAGIEFSVALKADGTVVAWGWNDYHQTNVPPDLSNVVGIAAGYSHTLALKADGTVVAWGDNSYGQAIVPAGLTDVVAVSAGAYHSLALKADGTVVGWGGAYFTPPNPAVIPPHLSGVTAISAGGYHSLALAFNGPLLLESPPQDLSVRQGSNAVFTVSATGEEPLTYQWLHNGVALTNGSRIAGADSPSLSLSNVLSSDFGSYSVNVSNGFGYISAAAALTVVGPPVITNRSPDRTVPVGSGVTMYVQAIGTPPLAYQWEFKGTNLPGATQSSLVLGNVQVSASGIYSVVVSNPYGSDWATISLTVTAAPPAIEIQPVSRSAPPGGSTTFMVRAFGSGPLTYQWRFNGVDIPDATNSSLTLVHLTYDQAGYYNVAVRNPFGETVSAKALLSISQVLEWGDPVAGATNIPPGMSNLVAIAAGGSHILALTDSGTVKAWVVNNNYRFDTYLATNVPPWLSNVVAIAAGREHNLALRANGTVIAWGGNSYLQTNVPAGLSNVISIAAGWYFSRAVRADGSLVSWGIQASPPPSGLSNLVAVACGIAHTVVLKRDGSVATWGTSVGTNVPPGVSNVIAIAASGYQSLAITREGRVIGWGQTNLPPNVSNVVAVAAGSGGVSLALRNNGTLAWSGSFGKNPPPSGLSNLIAIAAGGVQSGFGVGLVGDGSPAFALQPVSQIVAKGETVFLNGRAVGVQPVQYQWQLEGQDLPGATSPSLVLPNIQGKDTGRYLLVASNSLGVASSYVGTLTIPYTNSLAAALNATNVAWITNLDSPRPWFAENRVSHDGDAAAQSGAITNGQQTTLATTLIGPGQLSFWWKVSSEDGYDFLSFTIDGQTNRRISGEVDWQQVTMPISNGTHVVRWVYQKDGSVSSDQDAGWLDQVAWIQPPRIITSPTNLAVYVNSNATFQVVASGDQLTYQWFKNGTNLPGATQDTLVLSSVTRDDAGLYHVRVSNPGGSTFSGRATLSVLIPQTLTNPLLLADGSITLCSTYSDGVKLLSTDLPRFEAQVSTNLIDWTLLPTPMVLTNGQLLLLDPGATNSPLRFYRILERK